MSLPPGREEKRRERARDVMARGMGGGRKAARRVRAWTASPLGRTVLAFGIVVALLILLFALIGIPLIFRGTPVTVVRSLDGDAVTFGDLRAAREAAEFATGAVLERGSRVEILKDGEGTFPRLWQDLRSAASSITIINYYASAGGLADTLGAILEDRARAGVHVYFVYDPVGSAALEEGWLDSLRSSGVRVAEFRPLRWYRLDRANHRTHVRSIVIDGRIGYTGGYGLDDRWQGDGRSRDQWRETNVRVSGPLTDQLQAVFVAHWAEAAGELLADGGIEMAATDPPGTPADTARDEEGAAFAGILYSHAAFGSSTAERALAFSVATASSTLFISNAYFVPDDDFVRLLCEAEDRGVDVRVLTNGAKSDVPIAWLAGRRRYPRLLACGVRIFEYEPTVLHAKALVADGTWAMIGTINFDNRSLAFNDEVSLLSLGGDIGGAMDRDFEADLEHAIEITTEIFERRGTWQKLRERAADLVSRWL